MALSKILKNQSNKKRSGFAKKSLGQNFLIDEMIIAKIVNSLSLNPNDTIVEIGAGRGALTQQLIESGANVIAIEIDRDLIPLLSAKFERFQNFQLIEGDALKIDFRELTQSNAKVKLVANLPYYISTAIIQRLVESHEAFSELILMLQQEVAKRITSPPNRSERGFLTVLVEHYADTEKLFDVAPNAFVPVPKVWSSVVSLRMKNRTSDPNAQKFRQIVSQCFAQKRKTILNNLKAAKIENVSQILIECEINPTRRAESLTLDEWIRLTSAI